MIYLNFLVQSIKEIVHDTQSRNKTKMFIFFMVKNATEF